MGEDAPDLVVGDIRVPGEERTRCEVWTRIVGYYRPVSQWNAGKQSEYGDRRSFQPTDQQRLKV